MDDPHAQPVHEYLSDLDLDVLRGDGGTQEEATVHLTPLEWSGALLSPGEYLCRRIEAWDTLGNVSVFTHETHPQLVDHRFRYEYPHDGSGDQEGPELLSRDSEGG
jgi:hypothetical protein